MYAIGHGLRPTDAASGLGNHRAYQRVSDFPILLETSNFPQLRRLRSHVQPATNFPSALLATIKVSERRGTHQIPFIDITRARARNYHHVADYAEPVLDSVCPIYLVTVINSLPYINGF